MKNWPLGVRLAVSSALVVGLAILLCASGASYFLYRQALRDLDGQLHAEARQFLGQQRYSSKTEEWDFTEKKLPAPFVKKSRFVEIVGSGGRTLYRSENLHGNSLAGARGPFSYLWIVPDGVRVGVFDKGNIRLYLAASLDEIRDLIERLLLAFLAALPFVLGAVIFGGQWIARKALEPIRVLTHSAEQITAERLDQRLEIPKVQDEIGRLTTVLNEMFERLDKSFRQAARFSADASHELKTPLTILRAGIEDVLESRHLTPDDQLAIGVLLDQTRRLASITESLLLLSRADAGRLQLDVRPADVSEIVRACADDAHILAEPRNISIVTSLASDLHASVDAGRLTQILLNLLDNAVKYNHDGGEITVRAEKGPGARIQIAVANKGPGLSAQHASRIFERFYRFDPQSENSGAGLGLSIARELARAHGGDLRLVKSDAEWTEFQLTLLCGFT